MMVNINAIDLTFAFLAGIAVIWICVPTVLMASFLLKVRCNTKAETPEQGAGELASRQKVGQFEEQGFTSLGSCVLSYGPYFRSCHLVLGRPENNCMISINSVNGRCCVLTASRSKVFMTVDFSRTPIHSEYMNIEAWTIDSAFDIITAHEVDSNEFFLEKDRLLECSLDSFLLAMRVYVCQPVTVSFIKKESRQLLIVQLLNFLWVFFVIAIWFLLVVGFMGVPTEAGYWGICWFIIVFGACYKLKALLSPKQKWHPFDSN